jgi:hypothetical protein
MATETKYTVSENLRTYLSTTGEFVSFGDPNVAFFDTPTLASEALDQLSITGNFIVTTYLLKS